MADVSTNSYDKPDRRPSRLPYAHAIARSQIELLPGLDRERVVPRVEIARRIRAVLTGGVAVGDDLVALRRFAPLLAPRLGSADEKPLIAGESLPRRGG